LPGLEKLISKFAERVDIADDDTGCWEWQGKINHSRRGYGVFHYNDRRYRAHRMAFALTHFDNPLRWLHHPGSHLVCHGCNNPACVRPAHLYLGTHAENALDRTPEANAIAAGKLDPHDARHAYLSIKLFNEPTLQVAKRLGVARSTINDIAIGRSWGAFTAPLANAVAGNG